VLLCWAIGFLFITNLTPPTHSSIAKSLRIPKWVGLVAHHHQLLNSQQCGYGYIKCNSQGLSLLQGPTSNKIVMHKGFGVPTKI
jgi:hypothetical protein